MTEELPRNAADKRPGHEHRHDGQGGRHHRKPDLVCGFERRDIGLLAHAHMAHDVLDLDDGVVHQNADNQRQPQHDDVVEGEARDLHDQEGRKDRKRHSRGGDQGGAGVAQEPPHHEHGKPCTDQQGLDRGCVGLAREDRGRGHELDFDVGVILREFLELFIDVVGDIDFARTRGPHNAEGHHRGTVKARHLAFFAGAIVDRSEIRQTRRTPAGKDDADVAQLLHATGRTVGAERLLGCTHGAATAGPVHVDQLELLVDLVGGDTERHQSIRVEVDADHAAHAAGTRHLAHAVHRQQQASDLVIDHPGEIFLA